MIYCCIENKPTTMSHLLFGSSLLIIALNKYFTVDSGKTIKIINFEKFSRVFMMFYFGACFTVCFGAYFASILPSYLSLYLSLYNLLLSFLSFVGATLIVVSFMNFSVDVVTVADGNKTIEIINLEKFYFWCLYLAFLFFIWV